MDYPCETCLVRPACRNRLIRMDKNKRKEYLIIEYLLQCPMVNEFLDRYSDGTPKFKSYDVIYSFCKMLGATEGRYFVWYANTLPYPDN